MGQCTSRPAVERCDHPARADEGYWQAVDNNLVQLDDPKDRSMRNTGAERQKNSDLKILRDRWGDSAADAEAFFAKLEETKAQTQRQVDTDQQNVIESTASASSKEKIKEAEDDQIGRVQDCLARETRRRRYRGPKDEGGIPPSWAMDYDAEQQWTTISANGSSIFDYLRKHSCSSQWAAEKSSDGYRPYFHDNNKWEASSGQPATELQSNLSSAMPSLFDSAASVTPESGSSCSSPLEGMHVFLVSAFVDSINRYSQMLRDNGAHVSTARTKRAMLQCLESCHFSSVLLDTVSVFNGDLAKAEATLCAFRLWEESQQALMQKETVNSVGARVRKCRQRQSIVLFRGFECCEDERYTALQSSGLIDGLVDDESIEQLFHSVKKAACQTRCIYEG